MLRGSIKYLQTPTNNAHRDANFPDAPKVGINIGARYQWNKKLAFDVIYAHVFNGVVRINNTNLFGATTQGHVSTGIDLAGAQVVWNI